MTHPLNLAVEASQRGNHTRALSLFQDYLTRHPDDASGHAHLAMTLIRAGQPFAGRKEAQRALKGNPDLAIAHLVMAQVAIQLDDPVQAETSLAEALRIDPENAEALMIRGGGALRDLDIPALRAAGQALLARQPDNAMPYYFLSRAAALDGKGSEAEDFARTALRIAPEDASAHAAIGWAFWTQDKTDKARDAALSALSIDASYQDAHELLAMIGMRTNPVMGRLHKFAHMTDNVSVNKAIKLMGPFVLAYMIGYDILDFLEYDGFRDRLNNLVLLGTVVLLYSTHSYRKKATANKMAAALRLDY